jgi:hypothetical protein
MNHAMRSRGLRPDFLPCPTLVIPNSVILSEVALREEQSDAVERSLAAPQTSGESISLPVIATVIGIPFDFAVGYGYNGGVLCGKFMPNAPLRLVVMMFLSVPFVQGQNDSNRPYDSVLAQSIAEGKDAGTVGHLLQLGADPNSKTSEGVPVLIEAMHMTDRFLMGKRGNPDLEITTLLLDHGADPNALNKTWQTPLMAAAFSGNEKLVKVLLDHKANVNIGSKGGTTALIYARTMPVIKLLLAAGAAINDREIDGKTALYYATQRGDADGVNALLEAGANVNAKDDKGMTALSLARLRLCCSGPFADEHLREMDQKQSQDVIKILVTAGAVASDR